jgi:hypothetical protein
MATPAFDQNALYNNIAEVISVKLFEDPDPSAYEAMGQPESIPVVLRGQTKFVQPIVGIGVGGTAESPKLGVLSYVHPAEIDFQGLLHYIDFDKAARTDRGRLQFPDRRLCLRLPIERGALRSGYWLLYTDRFDDRSPVFAHRDSAE